MLMERYLVEKKEEIKELNVRKREIEFPLTSFGVAIVGPRRAGKTFSLYSLINSLHLKDEDYVFVNYEDDIVRTMKREEKVKIVDFHLELYKKHPKFIFLDEVQGLERWESFVYSLVEKKKYHLFITGSNSKLLSKEIATQLRGRLLTIPVFPFNFKEFIKLKSFKVEGPLSFSSISKIKGLLREYLSTTGFPPILIDNVNPKIFFKDYLDVIVFRDIMERYNVKNIYALRYLISSIISSYSSRFSINKIYNELKSGGMKIGKGVLYEYGQYLEDVMFSFFLKKFYFSERKSKLSVPKVYVCDLGLSNYSLKTKFSYDLGRSMENTVFVELKKRELSGEIDLFYWEDYQGREVDFVIKEGLRVKQLIQVTYASGRDEIEQREIRSLVKAGELFKKDRPELLVITWDLEGEEEVKGKRIKFIPLWKWLLEC